MSVPSASVSVVQSGVGILSTPAGNVCAVAGCSSKGPLATATVLSGGGPRSLSSILACTDLYGTGPAVKAAAYQFAKVQTTYIFLRLPATAVAATKSAVTFTGTGTSVVTLTGTPLDAYEIKVVCTTAGTIGTSASIKVSLDGGVTYAAPVALGVATTYVIAGTGLTLNFAAGTLVLADSATATTTAASQSVLPLTTTRVAASTSAITAAGAPEDAYEVRLEILTGGTRGTAGIIYRYSLDGGRTFTPSIALGTDVTILLLDGPRSLESTGVTVSIAAGTLDAGDVVTFNTTAPEWQASDFAAAVEILKASSLGWSFLHGVGAQPVAGMSTAGTEMSTLAASQRFTWSLFSARDRGTNETLATWAARLVALQSAFADDRIAVAAGMSRITCPITGRQNRRSAAWSTVPRILSKTIETDPGRKLDGPLSSDVSLVDANNMTVEYDAYLDSSLHDARFLTLRSWPDEPGVFVTRGNMMGGPSSDYKRIAYRRVMDNVSTVFQKMMTQQVENKFRRWSSTAKTPYKPGDIYEPDALKIEREFKSALDQQVTAQGQCSAVSVRLNRTPVLLSGGGYKLLADVKITGLGYIDEFVGTAGYTDPALDALLAAA